MIKNIDYKKYISYLLIAYAFSFPISKAATNLFEVLAIILWIIEGNWKEKFVLYKNNLLSITIMLLIGFSLLSVLWHGNAELTFKYILKYRHLIIIFIFYSSFDKKYSTYILSAFLAAMFISELMSYAIFFKVIQYKHVSPQDPTPFMDHMTYSTILAFTTNILLVYIFSEKNNNYKLFYLFFFITATTNLFINGGRTGQIIFIILIIVTILSSIKHKLKAILISCGLLLSTFFLAYTFSPNFQKGSLKIYQDIEKIIVHNNYTTSSGIRIALFLIGTHTFIDNSLSGTGLAYNMKDVQKYASLHDINIKNIETIGDYHNTFLTISVQLGAIGLLISILLIYSLFTLPIKSKKLKLLSLLFAISFVLFSITHNTLHTMSPMVFFALFAGYFNALSKYNLSS